MRALRLGLLALLVAYPVLVVLLAVAQGVALSPDSVAYLSTAQALADGRGLVAFDGQPLTLFPPGLPIVLGILEAAGLAATTVAGYLNALCLAVTVVATYVLGQLVLRSPWGALASAAVVSLSGAFLGVHVWLWSEPLFTALVVTLLALLVWAVRQGRASWWFVVTAGALASSAASVRYVGYTVVPVVALGVWWAARTTGGRSAMSRTVAAVGISLVAPVLIAARNVSVGSGPVGERYPGVRTLTDSAGDALRVLGEYFVGSPLVGVSQGLGVLLLVLVLAGGYTGLIHRDRATGIVAGFAALYLLAIVWSQTATRLDPPTSRLLAPVLPTLSVLALAGLTALMRKVSADSKTWAAVSGRAWIRQRGARILTGSAWVLVGIIVVGMAISSVREGQRLATEVRSGVIGIEGPVEASALIAAAKAIPDRQGLASNDPWSVYLGLGSGPVVALPPSPDEWPPARLQKDLGVLREGVDSGRVTHALVLAGRGAVTPLADLAAQGVASTLILETQEGSIYRLEPADPAR